jgi:predicted small secreted protein
MKKTFALLACVLLVVGFAACNTDKGPADLAIKAGDDAITAAAPEAEKYVPDQLTAARDAVTAAKDKFAKGQYKEALAAGKELTNTASALVAATAAKKDELTKAWNDLAASLPQTVVSIQAKIEELGKAKKLPKGMDKAMLAQAQEGLAGITKAWDEASAAFTAGNLGEALAKATPLKDKGAEVMALLGMAPAAPPAEAPAAAPAK